MSPIQTPNSCDQVLNLSGLQQEWQPGQILSSEVVSRNFAIPVMEQYEKRQSEQAISLARAYLIIFFLIPPLVLMTIVPHFLIWGRPLEVDFLTLGFFALFMLGATVHELLHGFGFWYFGGASWDALRFGMNWKAGVLYAECDVSISARAYRIAAVLPALILGFMPVLIGLSIGNSWFTGYGYIMLCISGGDFAVLWTVRNLSDSDLVRSHPEELGCIVLSSSPHPTSNTAGA